MKTLIAWIVVVIAALAGAYGVYTLELRMQEQEATINRLTEAQDAAQEREKAARKAVVARQAKIASEARKFDTGQEALKTALQAEKEWNDTEVPQGVQDALHGPGNGIAGDSGGPVSDWLRDDEVRGGVPGAGGAGAGLPNP